MAVESGPRSPGALPDYLPATQYRRTEVLARLRGALQLAWRHGDGGTCAHCERDTHLLEVHLPPDAPLILCPTCALTHVYGPRED